MKIDAKFGPGTAAIAMMSREVFRRGNSPVAVKIVAVTMDGVCLADAGKNDDCTACRPLDHVISFKEALDKFGVGLSRDINPSPSKFEANLVQYSG